MVPKILTDVVTISYVHESRTKSTWASPAGKRRFVIGAERLHGDSLGERLLSFTTLDAWKASLCDQVKQTGRGVRVKYRLTRYFDADLLFVELVKDQVRA